MKAFWVAALAGIGLVGVAGSATAQYYGQGYERSQGYGRGYDEPRRSRDYDRRGGGFDEGEYLRCNPDVRRAVRRGTMESGFSHYRTFGRREGRRLSC